MPGTSICFLFTVIFLVKTWVICWLIKDTFVSRRLSTLAREANFYLLWWKKNNHWSWCIILEWILRYQFVRYLKTYSLFQLHNYAIKPWWWFRLFHMEQCILFSILHSLLAWDNNISKRAKGPKGWYWSRTDTRCNMEKNMLYFLSLQTWL